MDKDKQPKPLSNTQLEEFKSKLPAWRAQADQWRKRLIDAYYAAKPGRRDRILRRVRGQLGELEMHIRHVEDMLRNDSIVRAAEAAG